MKNKSFSLFHSFSSKNKKKQIKYKVGSSTSFRACLTMCCVNNVIGKYHSKFTK